MAVVVADEEQDVLLGLEGDLAQVRLDVGRPAMQPLERVDPGLRGLDPALALLLARQLADRRIAPAAHRQGVRRVQQGLDLVDADRGILDVVAHPIGARLELVQGLVAPGCRS